MDAERLKNALKSTSVADYRAFTAIGSTNDEALAWIDSGAPDGSLVIADEQTKGRGRFERRWITRPGSSLAFSLILKPTPDEITRLALFAPLCGLAVHDALAGLLGLHPQIKWPNDVLLERKKCCGILVEAAWSGEKVNGIVLGIGINISPDSLPPDNDQLFTATCLEDILCRPVERFAVLQAVLQQIQAWRPRLGTRQFFDHWTEHLAFKDEQVRLVHSEKQSIIGIEKGIDPQGNLILILENHEERAFEVGDVHLRPLESSPESGG